MGKLWWGAAVLVALWAGPALADRRSGLAGNLLIEDPDDLFAFPQLTLQHRNLIRLDYGGTAETGNGVLTLGNEEHALAIALHRGDLLTPDVVGYNTELAWLGGVEGTGGALGRTSYASFPGPAAVDRASGNVLPATVLDVSYARTVNGNPLGVRLGFGRAVQAVRNDEVQKGAQTFVAAQVGYSQRPADALRWDASANAVFASGNASDATGADLYSGWNMRVAGLARVYYPLNDVVDVAMLGNLSLAGERSKAKQLGDRSSDLDFGMRAGVGPSIRLARAKVAAYGGLKIGTGKNEPNSYHDRDTNRVDLSAPFFNMAAEVQLLDCLYVRTGAEYTWELRRTSGITTQRLSDDVFHWSVGLGFQKGTFYFDGVVKSGFVTGGPHFLGGTRDGFLAMASMTYKFGDVFAKAFERKEPAREIALEIERPAVEPAAEPPPQELPVPTEPPSPPAHGPASPEASRRSAPARATGTP